MGEFGEARQVSELSTRARSSYEPMHSKCECGCQARVLTPSASSYGRCLQAAAAGGGVEEDLVLEDGIDDSEDLRVW